MLTPLPGTFIPLGFFPHGDLGPFTIYTTRRRKVVWYPRSPPITPPTWLQRRNRNRWIAAAATWRSSTPAQKQWWRQLAALNRLKITAYNLFIHLNAGNDPTGLVALKKPGTYPS